MLGFSFGCELTQRRELIFEVTGGCTTSVFPHAEKFLLASGDHQNALRYVAARKKMEVYRSMIDFLFCEIYREYRSACFKYYAGEGPPLRESSSREQIREWEEVLLHALKMALKVHGEKRRLSWVAFRSEVIRLAA
jgi:hypothetical protein